MSRSLSLRAVVLAALLAILLTAPSLWAGFVFDDYFMIALVEDWYGIETPAFNLYSSFMELPPMGWWRSEEPQVRFWRPLSSALFRLDHAVFGRHAVAHHAHSLLWLGALVGLCGALYRRLPPRVALVALFLFAVDESHALTSGILCNRHAVVALVFGLAGLWCHIRFRENGWRLGLPLSLAAYGLAFLGGEVALAAMAYVLAYELFAAPGSPRQRLAAVAPASLLAVVYVLGYKAAGFGTRESSLYLDPFGHPVEFLVGMTQHVPALLAEFLVAVPSALWGMGMSGPVVATGVVATLLVGAVLRWLWPSFDADDRRNVLFFGCGALMSLPPLALPQPMGRQLLVPMVGGAVVLALVLVRSWQRWRVVDVPKSRRYLAGTVAVAVVVLHFLAAPASRIVQLQGFVAANDASEDFADDVLQILLDHERNGERPSMVALFAADGPLVGVYPPLVHDYLYPQHMPWETLSFAPTDLRVTRTAERTLELTATTTAFFQSDLERFMRPSHEALAVGDRVQRPDFEAEIVAGDEKGATSIAFHFVHHLDDVLFLVWREGAYEVVEVPSIGGTLEIERPEPFGPF